MDKNQLLDALLRQSLSAFVQKTFATVDPGTPYSHNWHIDLIAEYLEACTRREIKRLIINIPPRYMKSIAVTVGWPAWLLGHNPSEQVIAASYAHKLSLKHSIDCRLVMRSDWYRRIFPGVKIVADQDTKEKYVTTERGMRYATSVAGSAIGEGGNFLIVDDPTSATEASSDVMRTAANGWFDQSFATRLNDKANGVIVVVMQRLHANDLTGHLLAKGGWEHLCIPAIAEQKTLIDFGRVRRDREAGDVLHPAREDAAGIEAQKKALGSYAFAGQYQQRPAPLEGGIFKLAWFPRYEAPLATYRRVVQSWDTAYKPGQENDPSACLTFGEHPGGYDLLHCLAERLEYPDLKARAMRHAADWGANAMLIEDKASGQSLIQDLRRETQLPVLSITVAANSGNKLTRAMAVSPLCEAGRVRLPRHAAWLADLEMELMNFPNDVHDDRVDALSQYLNWVRLSSAAAPMIRRL